MSSKELEKLSIWEQHKSFGENMGGFNGDLHYTYRFGGRSYRRRLGEAEPGAAAKKETRGSTTYLGTASKMGYTR